MSQALALLEFDERGRRHRWPSTACSSRRRWRCCAAARCTRGATWLWWAARWPAPRRPTPRAWLSGESQGALVDEVLLPDPHPVLAAAVAGGTEQLRAARPWACWRSRRRRPCCGASTRPSRRCRWTWSKSAWPTTWAAGRWRCLTACCPTCRRRWRTAADRLGGMATRCADPRCCRASTTPCARCSAAGTRFARLRILTPDGRRNGGGLTMFLGKVIGTPGARGGHRGHGGRAPAVGAAPGQARPTRGHALGLRRRHPHGRPRRDRLLGGQPRGRPDPGSLFRAGGPRGGGDRERHADRRGSGEDGRP